MFFAVYLLIAGVLFPIVLGYLIYKNLKKGVKPSVREGSSDEQSC